MIKNNIPILGLSNWEDSGIISKRKTRKETTFSSEIQNLVWEKASLTLMSKLPAVLKFATCRKEKEATKNLMCYKGYYVRINFRLVVCNLGI